MHVGSLELNRSPELIFKALSRIKSSNCKLFFFQYGLVLKQFQDIAVKNDIQDMVRFEGYIKSSEAVARIKGASLLVLLPTQNAPTAIPGKAYEYLRTGKPILLISNENATTKFMRQFPQVYHVMPEDEEKCFEVIMSIYRKDHIALRTFNNAIREYDRSKLTEKLSDELNVCLLES